jgi:hypothetical protein
MTIPSGKPAFMQAREYRNPQGCHDSRAKPRIQIETEIENGYGVNRLAKVLATSRKSGKQYNLHVCLAG